MKEHYSPIIGKGHSKKITIPSWVITAKLYKFEVTPDGSLLYTPVIR
jgi:hypothetical protein